MAEDAQQLPRKTGAMPFRTLLILGAVLLLEGAAISAAFLFAGGPTEVRADGLAAEAAAMAEQKVETLVVADKFQNTRSGRTFLYDTEIYIVAKRKHLPQIEMDLELMQARIQADIASVFRKAERAHLLEPELTTLKRQLQAVLTDRFGHDEDGESKVIEVLIPKCKEFRADI